MIMKRLISLFLIFVISLAYSLPVGARPFKKMSQLEIREVQTHVYDTSNTKEVFKATINTLQDNGFTIINVEDELGYIRAKKEFKGRRTDKKRVTGYSFLLAYYVACAAMSYGLTAGYIVIPVMRLKNELADKTVIVDTNANIEPYGKKTRVRLTMIEKVLENADGYSYIKSSPRKVVRIYSPLVYKAFFDELDKSIFYENI